MSNQQKKYRNWAFISLGGFVIFLILVQSKNIEKFDHFWQQLMISCRTPQATMIIKHLTHLASPLAVSLWVVLGSIFLAYHQQKAASIASLLVFASGGIILSILKHIVARPRPAARLVAESTWSFPSGHSFGAMLLALMLFYWVRPNFIQYKWLFNVFLIAGVVFIGFSRIYLEVHYPSDVLAGFLLANFWWYLCLAYFDNKKERFS